MMKDGNEKLICYDNLKRRKSQLDSVEFVSYQPKHNIPLRKSFKLYDLQDYELVEANFYCVMLQ